MPITQQVRIGLQGAIAYDSADNVASPTWVQIKHKIDAVLNMAWGEVDASDASSDWDQFEKGLINGDITFGYRKQGDSDTVFDWLVASMLDRAPKHFAFFRGAATDISVAGTYKGFEFVMHVMQNNESHNLKEAQKLDIVLKPAPNEDSLPAEITLTVV